MHNSKDMSFINLVYPLHPVTPVESFPAPPQGNQVTPEQKNCNSQFAMMYLYLLGLFSMTAEKICVENAVKGSLHIHLQNSFAIYFSILIIVTSASSFISWCSSCPLVF